MRQDFENKMKLAQTTLSRRDSLKIARRFNAGNGSPCASSPAGVRSRTRDRFNVHLHEAQEMSAPLSIRTLKRRERRAPGATESQRDSGLQPKVARHELPWVNVIRKFSNPNGVAASRRPTMTQPRWGCGDLSRLTQGSSSLATLGWRTQSRWDCPQKISAARN